MELSTKQPDGVRFRDADTILADLIEECDFQVTGIADELLRLYLEAENKDDFKSLFFFMTEKNFEDYLLESKKVMEENIAKANQELFKYIFQILVMMRKNLSFLKRTLQKMQSKIG
mgnify:CR=1 FL=1